MKYIFNHKIAKFLARLVLFLLWYGTLKVILIILSCSLFCVCYLIWNFKVYKREFNNGLSLFGFKTKSEFGIGREYYFKNPINYLLNKYE